MARDRKSPLPYRGPFGDVRPHPLDALPLPPGPMPSHDGLRPLKAWRYVGVFGPELMLCIGAVRIGRARQTFWAAWDRRERRLSERTALGTGGVTLRAGRAELRDRDIELDITLEEGPGIESVCPTGASYAWTRKQGGIRATGTATLAGRRQRIEARAVIDDTAGYYERRTAWRWCAGVGTLLDGREVAWNLVDGVNDPPRHSERTVWVGGAASEPGPCTFAEDLSSVDQLRFNSEAVRERHENLLLVRSDYRQPFGTFSGSLPGGLELAQGHGVMESHEARW